MTRKGKATGRTGYEPEFCHDCGRPVVEIAQETGKFDRDDASPRIRVRLACPEWPLLNHVPWNVGFFSHEGYHKRLEEQENAAQRAGRIGFDPGRFS